ncbi:type II secretion system protein [Candidatus Daviesbacteria bacterium]|nr:type II secretion system protein [Candidatus Daviesbacteria bacterium]
MKTKGFTLIELLITISIIAILSTIGLIVYTEVLQQGRDSKRQSDLRSIQSALEQYNHDQGFYPAATPSPLVFGSGNSLTSNTGNPNPSPSPKVYMNEVPAEPLPSPHAPYLYVPSGISYCLYAGLDRTNGANKPAVCTNATYNFAVTPP